MQVYHKKLGAKKYNNNNFIQLKFILYEKADKNTH